MNTHYDTLEVSTKASHETIRAAYRSLMQRYHPDKHPGDTHIASRAAEVTRAYDVIGDPGQRIIYDRQLANIAAARSPSASATQQNYNYERRSPSGIVQKRQSNNNSPAQQVNRRFLSLCFVVILLIAFAWWFKQRTVAADRLLQTRSDNSSTDKSQVLPLSQTSASTVPGESVIEIPDYISELRAPLLHASHKEASYLLLQRVSVKVTTTNPSVTGQLLKETFADAKTQITNHLAYLTEQELLSIEGKTLTNRAIAQGIRAAMRKPLLDPGWVLSSQSGKTASMAISTSTAAALAEDVVIVVMSQSDYLIKDGARPAPSESSAREPKISTELPQSQIPGKPGTVDIKSYITGLRVPLLQASQGAGTSLSIESISIKVATGDTDVANLLLKEAAYEAKLQVADQLSYMKDQSIRSSEAETWINQSIAQGIRDALRKTAKSSTSAGSSTPAGRNSATGLSPSLLLIVDEMQITVLQDRRYTIQ